MKKIRFYNDDTIFTENDEYLIDILPTSITVTFKSLEYLESIFFHKL